MKNRFTKIISVLAASMMLSTSAIANTYYRDTAMSVNSTDIQALSINLRKGVDTKTSSLESEIIDLRCDISCDSEGYTYVDFITDQPITVEDIEIPISFFDSVATVINATSDPCDIDLPEGYWMQTGYASGEILDEDDCTISGYQFIRSDNNRHTIDGKIITLRFAFSPMNMVNDSLHIPVMRWFQLEPKAANDTRFEHFEVINEYELYGDMPEVNISYLKEQERQINELNQQIEDLKAEIAYMKEYPNPDFNRDGEVTIADAVLLARYIAEA